MPLSPALDQALLHGSSVGGARPKALLREDGRQLIAKFSSTTDTYPVVKGEFVAMELARRAGIETATVELTKALGRDALLVERFDRPGGGRRAMVSALTILELDELGAPVRELRESREPDPRPLHAIRPRPCASSSPASPSTSSAATTTTTPATTPPSGTGPSSTLTPAYDICPRRGPAARPPRRWRSGADGYRFSQVAGCVARASTYLLSEAEAREIVDHQIEVDREPSGPTSATAPG